MCVCVFVSSSFALLLFVRRCRLLLLLVALPWLSVVVACRCRFATAALPFSSVVVVFAAVLCRLGLFVPVWSWSLVAVAVAVVGLGPWILLHMISHFLLRL